MTTNAPPLREPKRVTWYDQATDTVIGSYEPSDAENPVCPLCGNEGSGGETEARGIGEPVHFLHQLKPEHYFDRQVWELKEG